MDISTTNDGGIKLEFLNVLPEARASFGSNKYTPTLKKVILKVLTVIISSRMLILLDVANHGTYNSVSFVITLDDFIIQADFFGSTGNYLTEHITLQVNYKGYIYLRASALSMVIFITVQDTMYQNNNTLNILILLSRHFTQDGSRTSCQCWNSE